MITALDKACSYGGRPQAELWGHSSAGLESWRLAITDEIWIKSAGLLTSRLKLVFYDFFQVSGAFDRCGTKIAINLMNNTVYCL